ncbi:MAG: hypothetical protein ACXABI_03075 [Candidatus Hodarchaeales archaeon]
MNKLDCKPDKIKNFLTNACAWMGRESLISKNSTSDLGDKFNTELVGLLVFTL